MSSKRFGMREGNSPQATQCSTEETKSEECGCQAKGSEEIHNASGVDVKKEEIQKRSGISNAPTIDEETGCLVDALHLHMLHLIEQRISQQSTLDKQTSGGRLILAKSRFQQGLPHVTATLRLPEREPYRALCRVLVLATNWVSRLKLMRHNEDQARGYLLPVTRICGSLVPRSLRLATSKWEYCVDLVVECANTQRELQTLVRSMERLNRALRRRDSI